MEGPGRLRPPFLARGGLNGDFERTHIAVNFSRLEFFDLIGDPMGLAGDPKAGVVEDQHKCPFWFEVAVSRLEQLLCFFYILEG